MQPSFSFLSWESLQKYVLLFQQKRRRYFLLTLVIVLLLAAIIILVAVLTQNKEMKGKGGVLKNNAN